MQHRLVDTVGFLYLGRSNSLVEVLPTGTANFYLTWVAIVA